MKRIVVVALLAACGSSKTSAPPAPPPVTAPASKGVVKTVSFHSDALGVDKQYVVYLPGGYDTSTRRYPTIYMLNGLGGNETNWIELGGLDRAADQLGLQAIVVMADGDSSFYANWPAAEDPAVCARRGNPFGEGEPAASYCVVTPAYEDYITRDLIAHVDATYRTIASRAGRGIGGLSMGGFGALSLAMRHRDLYAATASHSGVDSLLYAGPFPYRAGEVALLADPTQWGKGVGAIGQLVRGVFGPDLANWRAHDPTTLAQTLSDGDLAIYLDCGTEDSFGLNNHAQYLHDVLRARGVKHDWYLGPGGHDFDFWSQRIDDSLGFFTRWLARATP